MTDLSADAASQHLVRLAITVVVAGSDPVLERSRFQLRRRMLVTGFLILALLAAGASYLMFRAISRELAAVRLQSDFVAAVSHEFRTPLTSLRQFTDMLRDIPALPDDRRRTAYDAQARATQRLLRLVESLLDFGRMEAGRHEYRFEMDDCGALVKDVVEDFQGEAGMPGHTIRVDTRGTVDARVDPEAFSCRSRGGRGRERASRAPRAARRDPAPTSTSRSPSDLSQRSRRGSASSRMGNPAPEAGEGCPVRQPISRGQSRNAVPKWWNTFSTGGAPPARKVPQWQGLANLAQGLRS